MKHYNIPVFIPHLGCPHDCIFCNQKKITGLEEHLDINALKAYIEDYLLELNSHDCERYIEVAFFGGSFTAIDEALQERYLKVAYEFKSKGLIQGIRLSTRPDYINESILKRLKKYGVDTIELGVQSLDQEVLQLSQRGYEASIVYEATGLIKKENFTLGLQMMIGLPGDSKAKSLRTAGEIAKINPDFIRIYPTLVIENTPLEALYYKKIYKALSLEEAIDWTKALTYLFNSHNIPMIRVGLQDSKILSDHCVAGPYHPSFKQLVLSEMVLDCIKAQLEKYDRVDSLSFEGHIKSISEIVGQKRSNFKYLEEKYHLKHIKIYKKEMSEDQLVMVINDQRVLLNKYHQENI